MYLVCRVFPDVKVVQSHRDSPQTLPPLSRLLAGIWTIYAALADPGDAGRQWVRGCARGMGHRIAGRDPIAERQCPGLWLEDTVRQPQAEIERVYEFPGMALIVGAWAERARWQDFNRRELCSSHGRKLAQFGFTEAGLKRQLSAYR